MPGLEGSRSRLLLVLLCVLGAGCGPDTPAADWERLFDGASLEGWQTTGGRYDGKARWYVEDGAIVGEEGENHAGGLLYTQGIYRDFELECCVWMTYPFDSGVFLRQTPDANGAQVTLDHRPGGEIAGIYSDGWLQHNKDGETRWIKGHWNQVRVRCTGEPMHITVWLNDEQVLDYRMPEGTTGYAAEGRIGLQVHGARSDPPGSKVKFKNLRVRRIARSAE